MSSNQNTRPEAQKFAKGDIFEDYNPSDNPDKFEYLKAKYIFRFPFTITSIKWGFTLGTIFGLHTYIKTKHFGKSFYWFVWGSILSTLPIWGFFMFKYSFYTMTLRKFEVDQFAQSEDSYILRDYMLTKIKGNPEIKNKLSDEQIVKKIEQRQVKELKKHSQLDFLLDEDNYNDDDFRLIPEEEKINKDN